MPSRLLLVLSVVVFTGSVDAADPIDFNRDVRPILSDTCFKCHGPDSRTRKAKLRLDTAEGIGDGKELLRRVLATAADEVMPPPKEEKKLTPQQVAILKAWVAQGAKYEGHWSFQPLEKPTPPGGVHPIDALVQKELSKVQLKPAPQADRVTLIRRVALDLTGLPPKPADVEAFLADKSPKAYEAMVDRYLASPHYGERMAMFWLDLVRYADSVGYHGDQPVSVSPYRDWVIEAFNKNMRFDQFTTWQLAGDLLPNPTTAMKVAAGYNRLGMMSAEGGVQPKEYLAKYAAERVRNLGGAWLGVTLGCCECHDHKFDPFSAKDFYRLEAFFADIQERGIYDGGNFGPSMPVPTPEQEAKLSQLEQKIAALRATLDRSTPELEKAQQEWERTLKKSAEWKVLTPLTAKSLAGSKLTPQAGGSILASGKNPATDSYTITALLPKGNYTGVRVEALPHESLPAKGPGRAGNGNFVLTEIEVSLTKKDGTPTPVAWQKATETFAQTQFAETSPYKKFSAEGAIDGDKQGKKWGWAVLPEVGKPQNAVFEAKADFVGEDDTVITIVLHQNLDNPNHVLGHFRLAVTTSPRPVVAEGAGMTPEIQAIVTLAVDKRSAEQKAKLAAYYRGIAPALTATRAELASVEQQKTALVQSMPSTLVTVKVAPRPIRVLARGNWMDDSGALVEPGFPEALPGPKAGKERLTRLDLAKWVTAADNPLTSRALANRLWKQLFGAGISRKLDDLGSQGEWPTHPELLDYLAGKIVESGWDIKATIKLIMMSQTYQQSSVATKEQVDKDPFNKWLARQGRFRLDAELVRDNALAVSGLLVETLGGPSVRPYQPAGYWAYLNFPTREWQNDQGDRLYRRGLYTHWQRQYLHPSLMAFDAPSREECTAERVRSNTPLQALVLLNDPIYVESARAFAERTIKAGATDADRLDWMYRQALSRPIQPKEQEILLGLLKKHRDEYKADPKAADALLSVGARPAPQGDRIELAAWTSIARAILNLHAVVTRN